MVGLQNPIDIILNKFISSTTPRKLSWVNCVLNKCRKSKVSDPLIIEKVLVQRKFLIERE